jgi:hypothetical protein
MLVCDVYIACSFHFLENVVEHSASLCQLFCVYTFKNVFILNLVLCENLYRVIQGPL